jgi:ribonuclease HII
MRCGLRFEKHLWSTGIPLLAGVDEAGRGPLAGPVVAAAAVLPAEFSLSGLNDSKQLAEPVREQLFEALMIPGKLVCYGVGIAEPGEIDRLNILRATFVAMERAVMALPILPDHLLTRDRIMRKWHNEFPQYDFYQNKGYATPAHLESLQIHGPCAIHRRSFAPIAQTYFIFR